MELNGFYTEKGLALSAQLLEGETLTITHVRAGSGSTLPTASGLEKTCQTLAVNTACRNGTTVTLPVTLTMALAAKPYTLTELGVYAEDPCEGEILYKIYRLDAPVEIDPASQSVLRFYLRETVLEGCGADVVCSPAGLVTEEMFLPVRDRVQATAAAVQHISVAGSDLASYLASLPRLLTHQLVLSVSGTVTEPLSINGFYGGGSLYIRGSSSAPLVITNTVTIENCLSYVEMDSCDLTAPEALGNNSSLLNVSRSPSVHIKHCSLTGNGVCRGIGVAYGTQAHLSNCTFTNFHTVVLVMTASLATFDCTADCGTNNQFGVYVYCGGIVILARNTPLLLGGTTNINQGGLIVNSAGAVS